MRGRWIGAAVLAGVLLGGGCAAAPTEPAPEPAPRTGAPAAPGAMPPARADLTLSGRILQHHRRTGAELGMQPGAMVIHNYRFRVERPGDSGLTAGAVIELRSKLAPPDGWRHRPLTIRVASYAGGSAYWLVGFAGESSGGRSGAGG